MTFSREHLSGDYNWATDQEPAMFEGTPSRRRFDRHNGNQVLFIISFLLEKLGDASIKQGSNIEMTILQKLPFVSSSELTVVNWLEKELNATK